MPPVILTAPVVDDVAVELLVSVTTPPTERLPVWFEKGMEVVLVGVAVCVNVTVLLPTAGTSKYVECRPANVLMNNLYEAAPSTEVQLQVIDPVVPVVADDPSAPAAVVEPSFATATTFA
jgi:hypothetical protein